MTLQAVHFSLRRYYKSAGNFLPKHRVQVEQVDRSSQEGEPPTVLWNSTEFSRTFGNYLRLDFLPETVESTNNIFSHQRFSWQTDSTGSRRF